VPLRRRKAARRPGGIGVTEERELYQLKDSLRQYPAAARAILDASKRLHRPVDALPFQNIETAQQEIAGGCACRPLREMYEVAVWRNRAVEQDRHPPTDSVCLPTATAKYGQARDKSGRNPKPTPANARHTSIRDAAGRDGAHASVNPVLRRIPLRARGESWAP
jgi:hypothetical protein